MLISEAYHGPPGALGQCEDGTENEATGSLGPDLSLKHWLSSQDCMSFSEPLSTRLPWLWQVKFSKPHVPNSHSTSSTLQGRHTEMDRIDVFLAHSFDHQDSHWAAEKYCTATQKHLICCRYKESISYTKCLP